MLFQCVYCGHIAESDKFKYGLGREFGEHPEHRYCPECGQSIDWHGFKILWEEEDELCKK